jgi:hypothetical protein
MGARRNPTCAACHVERDSGANRPVDFGVQSRRHVGLVIGFAVDPTAHKFQMDWGSLLPLVFLLALGAVIFGIDALVRWLRSADWVAPPTKETTRKSVGHAMLGLQQFVDPRAEHIVEAEQHEEREEDGLAGDVDDEVTIRSGLTEALGRSPLDPEEIRRHLREAARAGLDWRLLYAEATTAELSARPYRAPSIPPATRVAPRLDD